jgi:hypothetical protein
MDSIIATNNVYGYHAIRTVGSPGCLTTDQRPPPQPQTDLPPPWATATGPPNGTLSIAPEAVERARAVVVERMVGQRGKVVVERDTGSWIEPVPVQRFVSGEVGFRSSRARDPRRQRRRISGLHVDVSDVLGERQEQGLQRTRSGSTGPLATSAGSVQDSGRLGSI